MNNEIWKPIFGWECYEVSNHGRVRHVRILSTPVGHTYRLVGFSVKRKKLTKNVHVLVAETFLGPRPTKKHHCCHIDGNPLNNSLENLKWATQVENESHKYLHGTRLLGESLHNSKFTESEIRAIRKSGLSGAELARKYKVTQSSISGIKLRKTWKHIA